MRTLHSNARPFVAETFTVNYAASVVLEVRQDASSSAEPVVRFTFKNGTEDSFHTYPMRFAGWDGTANANADVPLSTFVNAFTPAGVNTTLEWCNVCGQTQERGCAALFAGNGTASVAALGGHHERISPVGAGFLGAGLTVAVFGLVAAVLVFLGLLTVGRKGRKATKGKQNDHVELSSAVRCRVSVMPEGEGS